MNEQSQILMKESDFFENELQNIEWESGSQTDDEINEEDHPDFIEMKKIYDLFQITIHQFKKYMNDNKVDEMTQVFDTAHTQYLELQRLHRKIQDTLKDVGGEKLDWNEIRDHLNSLLSKDSTKNSTGRKEDQNTLRWNEDLQPEKVDDKWNEDLHPETHEEEDAEDPDGWGLNTVK